MIVSSNLDSSNEYSCAPSRFSHGKTQVHMVQDISGVACTSVAICMYAHVHVMFSARPAARGLRAHRSPRGSRAAMRYLAATKGSLNLKQLHLAGTTF